VARDPRQLERQLGSDDVDRIAGCERATDLAVDDQGHSLGYVVHGQGVAAIGSIDQRPIAEGVWVQRGDDKCLQVLSQNGTASREAVGGRSDRGADDHPVTAEGGHFLAIDFEADVKHRQAGSGREGDFVEPGDRFGLPCAGLVMTFKHQVLDDPVLSVANRRQVAAEFLNGKIGEEAESSEIDAEDRPLRGGELAAGSQDRAVTPQYDHQVGLGGSVLEVLGHSRGHHPDTLLLIEEIGKFRPRVLDTGALVSGEYDQVEVGAGHGTCRRVAGCGNRVKLSTMLRATATGGTVNYFAHGLRFVDRPWFLAGTAVPDWLSVVDRRMRMRQRLVTPFADGSGSMVAEVAAGALQHLEDDQYFHRCRAFVEVSGALAVAFRDRLPDGPEYRPGVLGHITCELVLDGVLIERDPGRLEQYYDALGRVDPEMVQLAVNGMARGGTTEMLAEMIVQFRERRFLGDYVDPVRLLYRLNQVMRRIKLAALPDDVLGVIRRGRELVEPRVSEMLGWTPPDPGTVVAGKDESIEERTETS